MAKCAKVAVLGDRKKCSITRAFVKNTGGVDALRKAMPNLEWIDADKSEFLTDYARYRPPTALNFVLLRGLDSKNKEVFKIQCDRYTKLADVIEDVTAACPDCCGDAPPITPDAPSCGCTCPNCGKALKIVLA